MQVSFNQKLAGPSFKSGYNVMSVFINGKYYGQTQYDAIHRVATAFSTDMYRRNLSPNLMKKAYEFFPDFKTLRSSTVAFTKSRKYRVNIFAGYDSYMYRNNFKTREDRRTQIINAYDTASRILEATGKKRIIIHAEEKYGKLTITDIEHAE